MSYIGENNYFSFRDNYTEAIKPVSSVEVAELGRKIAPFFSRFSIGTNCFSRLHILYALCSSIAECGKDVYVCENTDMPSFRFGYPLLSADCGIFINGCSELKLSFFGSSGFALDEYTLKEIFNAPPSSPSERSGRIYSTTSFNNIYINNIADTMNDRKIIDAGISCGNRTVRNLWLAFFSGESDELVFQISDDGQRVNAYSAKAGFISYEKIMLAYCLNQTEKNNTVWLPDTFHYGADYLSTDKIKRFNIKTGLPKNAENTRFLRDSLYMCCHVTENLVETVERLPKIASIKREIIMTSSEPFIHEKTIRDRRGRIIITQSGKNRLSLIAQSLSAETASELCEIWTEKIRRQNL